MKTLFRHPHGSNRLSIVCSRIKEQRQHLTPARKKKEYNTLLKYKGKSYVSKNGKTFLGRHLRPPCGSNCLFQCSKKITHEQRQAIFDEYYALGSKYLQWAYLGRLMDKTIPKLPQSSKHVVTKKRINNVRYFLIFGNQRLRVCRFIFLATFDITEGVTRTVIQKTDDNGILIDKDQRGLHTKLRWELASRNEQIG